jgi:type IV pilus assembly protein PilM
MARRLIGLDIGTNAVTVAEVRPGEPPRLDLFGQVALGRDTMREGEITDDAAVTDAVARLRAEVGLKKVAVRLGLASPRVVVRQIEMPQMTREELGSALQFQAAELIPIPLDDAVLDYAILGPANPGDGGEPRMHVLLAAVQEATALRLVAAVEAGGLQVAAVDLVPLALIRSLAGSARDRALVGAAVAAHEGAPVPADGGGVALAERSGGAEGIVSFGGGVTAIAVHELGVPRFVRVLGTGGRELTDAIASELDLPPETAEALKRQLGAPAGHEPNHEELVARARGSIERPLSVLLDEVRSSIDYYRNQPDSSPLMRIIATGGAAQLPGLTDRLSALVGVPVEDARPRELVALGDIGFADEELPRLDPYLPAAVGLALGGAGVGTVINLLPRARAKSRARRVQIPPKVMAAGAAVVVGLGGVTFLTQHSLSSAKAKRAATEEQVARATSELTSLQPILDRETKISALQSSIQSQLTTDVAWQNMVKRITAHLPAGITLTAFSGQVTPPAPVLAPPPAAATSDSSSSASSAPTTTTVPAPVAAAPILTGTVSISGTAKDYPTLASWIDDMGKVPEISDVYVTTAQEVANSSGGTAKKVTFTATAVVAPGAVSHRLEQYTKAGS